MRLDQLTGYTAFVAVARKRNFRAASSELRVSASAVSQAVASLEQRLGVRLFERTTRSVRLTDAGAALLAKIDGPLEELGRAADGLSEFAERPRGTLRVSAPRAAFPVLLRPLLPRFLADHPELSVEVAVSDEMEDIVAAGFDCGIRIGELLDRDMVALKLGPDIESAVVGSPAYFRRHPEPRSLEDLARHRCIRHRFADGDLYRWEFERRGRELSIDPPASLVLDDITLAVRAALDGAGLAYVFDANVREELARGRLRRVLEPFSPRYPGFHLYYPSRKQVPAKLRVFIEAIRRTAAPTA